MASPSRPTLVGDKKLSIVSKWFCDRLLRTPVRKREPKPEPSSPIEPFLTPDQSLSTRSVSAIVKRCSEQNKIPIAVLGHGSDILLHALQHPSSLAQENLKFVFYGENVEKFTQTRTTFQCLLCVVDDEGLTSNIRSFMLRSGFLHKLIRHPKEFVVFFLLDETKQGSFSREESNQLLRQQFVALLKEHAPGPYAKTVTRIAVSSNMIFIRAKEYLTLCSSERESKQKMKNTGIPKVLARLQNLSISKCAGPISNISNDWIGKTKRRCLSQSNEVDFKVSPPISAPVKKQKVSLTPNAVSSAILQSFLGLKELIISKARNMDLVLAKAAKQSYNTWLEHTEVLRDQEKSTESSVSYNILYNVLIQEITPHLPKESICDVVSLKMNAMTRISAELLSNCLRHFGVLPKTPSAKLRIKKLAEYCTISHKQTMEHIAIVSQLSVNVHELIRDCCHLVFTSHSDNPRHSLNLPLKAIQHIRIRYTELSTKILGGLREIEQHLCTTIHTILTVLQASPEEVQQPLLHHVTCSHTSLERITFRPFNNLLFDTTEWALFSFLGPSLSPNVSSYEEQLRCSKVKVKILEDQDTKKQKFQDSLFLSLSHQLYGTEALSPIVRLLVCHEILEHSSRYEPYFLASNCDLQEYVARMSLPGEPGDHVSLLAFVNYYKVNVWVYSPVLSSPIRVLSSKKKAATTPTHASFLSTPLKIAYVENNHFHSLIPRQLENESKKRKREEEEEEENNSLPQAKRRCFFHNHSSQPIKSRLPYQLGSHAISRCVPSLKELCTNVIATHGHLIPPLQGTVPVDVLQPIIRKWNESGNIHDENLENLLDGSSLLSLDLSHTSMDYSTCAVVARHSSTLTHFTLNECHQMTDEGFSLLLGANGQTSNKLSFLSLSGCKQLTNASLQLIPLYSPEMEEIEMSGCAGLQDTTVYDLLENCNHLLSFSASHCSQLSDQAFISSRKALKVKKVEIDGTSVSDASVLSLCKRTNGKLESLRISGKQITDLSLEALSGNKELRHLYIFRSSITERGVRTLIESCKHLETLHLSGNELLSELMFHPILEKNESRKEYYAFRGSAFLTKLTSLDISFCPLVNDTTLDAISRCMPSLMHLNVAGCDKISDRGLLAQFSLHSPSSPSPLVHLDLSKCFLITDVCVKRIAACCPQLSFLSLFHCKQVTDLAMAHLSTHCNYLTYLNVSSCEKITDAGFEQIRFPNLTTLCLGDCSISDEAAASVLINSPLLSHVDLSFCSKLNAKAMNALSTCSALSFLNISYCNSLPLDLLQQTILSLPLLTDLRLQGYMHLTSSTISHPTVQKLDISWCKNLQNEAMTDLLVNIPLLQSLDVSWCTSLYLPAAQRFAPALNSFLAVGL